MAPATSVQSPVTAGADNSEPVKVIITSLPDLLTLRLGGKVLPKFRNWATNSRSYACQPVALATGDVMVIVELLVVVTAPITPTVEANSEGNDSCELARA